MRTETLYLIASHEGAILEVPVIGISQTTAAPANSKENTTSQLYSVSFSLLLFQATEFGGIFLYTKA